MMWPRRAATRVWSLGVSTVQPCEWTSWTSASLGARFSPTFRNVGGLLSSKAPTGGRRDFSMLSGVFGRGRTRSPDAVEQNVTGVLSSLEEVEKNRPLAPDPCDGTYQMPARAPNPSNLSRDQFHQFMQGKPQRFSQELKVAVIGISLALFGIGVTALTMHIMRPDDFEWVEEERRRLQQAKERIQQNIRKASSEGP